MNASYLTGQLLVAMPGMLDIRFTRAVIYVCHHTPAGAMGLVVNRLLGNITFQELLDNIDLPANEAKKEIPIHEGGPVETGRGFVLHGTDFTHDDTIQIDSSLAITCTTDILREIALGGGPKNSLFMLGYAGWGPGQLDIEIRENGWLNIEASTDLLFKTGTHQKWEQALRSLSIDPALLSLDAGHA